MNIQKIENEVGQLPVQEQRQLLRWLVATLDAPSEEELRSEWLHEAGRRAAELDSGKVTPVPSEEVMRKARALLG